MLVSVGVLQVLQDTERTIDHVQNFYSEPRKKQPQPYSGCNFCAVASKFSQDEHLSNLSEGAEASNSRQAVSRGHLMGCPQRGWCCRDVCRDTVCMHICVFFTYCRVT